MGAKGTLSIFQHPELPQKQDSSEGNLNEQAVSHGAVLFPSPSLVLSPRDSPVLPLSVCVALDEGFQPGYVIIT